MLVLAVAISIIGLALILGLLWRWRTSVSCAADPILAQLKRDAVRIDPRAANLTFYPANQSYTMEKKRVYLCLQDPKTGEYYDHNTLVAVLTHELAHSMSSVMDPEHKTIEFKQEHARLRQRAIDLGLLDPSKPVPPEYCLD